jgi:hypothetical protein
MFENIISGFIGGLLVLIIQFLVDLIKKRKKEDNDRKVGNQKLKIIDYNFIYTYEPHKISIEKIVDDFGQPLKVYDDQIDNCKLKLYQYNFQNAKVLFSKMSESSEIISITLFSTNDRKNPILCRMSFENEDTEMGKAKINQAIIKDNIRLENSNNGLNRVCIIKAKYFFRQIKHLTFAYQIDGNYEDIKQSKNNIINQVCVTQIESITPFFSFYDTFYN